MSLSFLDIDVSSAIRKPEQPIHHIVFTLILSQRCAQLDCISAGQHDLRSADCSESVSKSPTNVSLVRSSTRAPAQQLQQVVTEAQAIGRNRTRAKRFGLAVVLITTAALLSLVYVNLSFNSLPGSPLATSIPSSMVPYVVASSGEWTIVHKPKGWASTSRTVPGELIDVGLQDNSTVQDWIRSTGDVESDGKPVNVLHEGASGLLLIGATPMEAARLHSLVENGSVSFQYTVVLSASAIANASIWSGRVLSSALWCNQSVETVRDDMMCNVCSDATISSCQNVTANVLTVTTINTQDTRVTLILEVQTTHPRSDVLMQLLNAHGFFGRVNDGSSSEGKISSLRAAVNRGSSEHTALYDTASPKELNLRSPESATANELDYGSWYLSTIELSDASGRHFKTKQNIPPFDRTWH